MKAEFHKKLERRKRKIIDIPFDKDYDSIFVLIW